MTRANLVRMRVKSPVKEDLFFFVSVPFKEAMKKQTALFIIRNSRLDTTFSSDCFCLLLNVSMNYFTSIIFSAYMYNNVRY